MVLRQTVSTRCFRTTRRDRDFGATMRMRRDGTMLERRAGIFLLLLLQDQTNWKGWVHTLYQRSVRFEHKDCTSFRRDDAHACLTTQCMHCWVELDSGVWR
jgi:hypothetical protein